MDWLRSEDLKEEKVLTTSTLTITRQERISSFQMGTVTEFDVQCRDLAFHCPVTANRELIMRDIINDKH